MLLAVGCKPANATGFNSLGDEGSLVGAGSGRVKFVMAPDIVIKVLAWTYAIGADHNGAQATERWGQMMLRLAAVQRRANRWFSSRAVMSRARPGLHSPHAGVACS